MNLLILLTIVSMHLPKDACIEKPFEPTDKYNIYFDESYDKTITDFDLNIFFFIPLRFYQIFISPAQGEICNFTPSCSNYMIKAINKYGALKGFVMGIDRLQRCNHGCRNYLYLYYPELVNIENRGYKLIDEP